MAADASTKREMNIMGTNNSSIVSKRSVERLYYPEPWFFKYFVKKPQRRSPLINRGYWLRMESIYYGIREFMHRGSDRRKVVVNLGCGYDPLPFQALVRCHSHAENVKFIDVDYKPLMLTKRDMIMKTPKLKACLNNIQCFDDEEDPVVLQSYEYLGVGCDLQDVTSLDQALKAHFDISKCKVLFLAEVSTTYMEPDAANALIAWAAKSADIVDFRLVEQFIPAGLNHPFAQTMLKHFEKLQTPLRAVHRYPSLLDQERRFQAAGWQNVKARSLWDLWSDHDFLVPSERLRLDSIEAFDEWEEFTLFASHYFLLAASNNDKKPESTLPNLSHLSLGDEAYPITSKLNLKMTHTHSSGQGRRKFAAAIREVEQLVALHGGHGTSIRLASTDNYSPAGVQTPDSVPPPASVLPRMCHTITDLGNGKLLLVGGRASPSAAMADCWLREDGAWRRVQDLPAPRYRHSTVAVKTKAGLPGAIVVGGKGGEGQVKDDWLFWDLKTGWRKLQTIYKAPVPRFGATFLSFGEDNGVIFGGMRQDGTIFEDCWIWKLIQTDCRSDIHCLRVTGPGITSPHSLRLLGRFGASSAAISDGFIVLGGVAREGCVPRSHEAFYLGPANFDVNWAGNSSDREAYLKSFISAVELRTTDNAPLPLSVGHSLVSTRAGQALMLGGGAVCFSFGSYWNEGTWLLQEASDDREEAWLMRSDLPVDQQKTTSCQTDGDCPPAKESGIRRIPRITLKTSLEFCDVVNSRQPRILERLDLGPCTSLWTLDYLKEKIGNERRVTIHDAQTSNMNFQAKNFDYSSKGFADFIDSVRTGGRQYLRSLAVENPSQVPSKLENDFPEIAGDFRLPTELMLVTDNAHSSPFRVSGPVTMWLHYDVLANVLCQISGTKRLILYPPSDIGHLQIPHGGSSSTLNIFENGPASPRRITDTHPHEAVLKAGDVLFIPPLWSHTAAPTDGTSIAVNVFFRDLPKGYAAGRDVYGNRDLQAYETGRRDVDKILRAFRDLPADVARFYLDRLAGELREGAAKAQSAPAT